MAGKIRYFVAAALAAVVGLTIATTSSATGSAYVQPKPIMTSTFVQPSINAAYPTINWTVGQFNADFKKMSQAGIHDVIVQWTVDRDANQAYYPSSPGWFPRVGNMVGNVMSAADTQNVNHVWLGLANTYNWQAHANDPAWLNSQAYDDITTADQLFALYGTKIAGWYISNEVSDTQLGIPVDATAVQGFFTTLTTYLHSHDGNLPVMESPTYQNLSLTPTQFASDAHTTLGTVDVLNVQDSGGSGYIHPADITNWFTALATEFSGSSTKIWTNPDMFDSTSHGPMPPTLLQQDIGATNGLVSSVSGFSFITQLDPGILGTYGYYDAYRAYAIGKY